MAATDITGLAAIAQIAVIAAYFMQYEPEDYVFTPRNAEGCWYPPTCAVMTDLVPELQKSNAIYDKASALQDADSVVSSTFEAFRDSTLVRIYAPMCIANGYNSTTAQLLADNAYAKTVSAAASIKLDNIKTYAGIRVSDLQVMAQLISSIKNSLSPLTVSTAAQGLSVGDVVRQIGEIRNTGMMSPW